MDNFTRSLNNMFVAQVLNRAGIQRKRAEWILERLDAPDSVFVPVWESRVLVSDGSEPRAVLLPFERIQRLSRQDEECIFLGRLGERCYFAVNIETADGAPPDNLADSGRFRDLRAVGPLLSQEDGALLAYAKTMTYWHGRNRFCGVCGSPAKLAEGGHQRACTNPDCGALHFPRTDPAIIMLVSSGGKCLLGRQAIWPERMYSVLAGFVEPGESAEAAVIREAFEEAGIRVRNINYHSSQPWPFPCSLMLGFTAEAEKELACPVDGELENLRWFSREEFRQSIESGEIRLPSRISIAYQLIRGWFEFDGSMSLSELAIPGRTV